MNIKASRYLKLVSAIVAAAVVVSSFVTQKGQSPYGEASHSPAGTVPVLLAPGSRFEQCLIDNKNFKEALEFLRSLGIKKGSSVINIGDLNNSNLPLAAAYIGASYTAYDLRDRSNLIQLVERMGLKSMGGSAQLIQGEFSSKPTSASQNIPNKSQDVVLMLTGVLSDPYPESEPAEVLMEALRVVKNGGKIVIGSFKWIWNKHGELLLTEEKADAQRLIKGVLEKPSLGGKVRLIKGERIDYFICAGDIYEAEFITPDQPANGAPESGKAVIANFMDIFMKNPASAIHKGRKITYTNASKVALDYTEVLGTAECHSCVSIVCRMDASANEPGTNDLVHTMGISGLSPMGGIKHAKNDIDKYFHYVNSRKSVFVITFDEIYESQYKLTADHILEKYANSRVLLVSVGGGKGKSVITMKEGIAIGAKDITPGINGEPEEDSEKTAVLTWEEIDSMFQDKRSIIKDFDNLVTQTEKLSANGHVGQPGDRFRGSNDVRGSL